MSGRARLFAEWILPAAVLVGASVWIRATGLDVEVASRFWSAAGGWIYADDQPWSALYKYGPAPAWLIVAASLAVLVGGRWIARWAGHRRAAVFLILVMVVGPGLVVNSTFKQNWGRPRPMDLVEFGGRRDFVPVLNKGNPEHGASFPSGHASTGFYLLAPYFLFRGRRRWAWTFLLLGLLAGGFIGTARMVQGKHFLSDVLWSGGFVYFTALILSRILSPRDAS